MAEQILVIVRKTRHLSDDLSLFCSERSNRFNYFRMSGHWHNLLPLMNSLRFKCFLLGVHYPSFCVGLLDAYQHEYLSCIWITDFYTGSDARYVLCDRWGLPEVLYLMKLALPFMINQCVHRRQWMLILKSLVIKGFGVINETYNSRYYHYSS